MFVKKLVVSRNGEKNEEIYKQSISSMTAEISKSVYAYTGKAIKPSVTLTDGTTTISSENYTVTYKNNTDPGTATITIKGTENYKGTVTLTFTIKPENVSDLKTKSNTSSSIKLSWTASTGATSYKVYRYYNGSWHYYKTTSNTYLNIKGLSAGKKYRFRVRAYNSDTKTYSSYTYYTGKTKPANISTLKVKAKTKHAITLTWSKSSGANRYKIYRYYGGKWHLIKITSNRTYKITGLSSGKSYKIRIRAYNTNTKTYSGYKTITVKTK